MKTWMRRVQLMLVCAGLALLSACGGGGSGGGGDAPSTGGSTPTGSTSTDTHQLFVGDIAHGVIAMLPNANPSAGTSLATQGTLAVSQLGHGLAWDSARDVLYALSGSSVVVYANASKLADGAAPTRTIALPSDVLFAGGLVLDASHDTLYVGASRRYDGEVLVLANASSASGAAVVARAMTVNDGVNDFAIDFTRATLYVVNSITGIHVFTGADTASGVIVASRNMLGATPFTGLAVDAGHDRLYAASVSGGVQIVAAASTASASMVGAVALASTQFLALDAASDRLYVGAYDKAYLLAPASTLAAGSSVPAAAVSAGSGTSIGGFAFR